MFNRTLPHPVLITGLALLMVATLGVTPARAEVTPQQKVMAKRAAQLDGYRKMAERIMGLQLSGTSTVQDFVLEDDKIAADLDHFIKGLRATDTRYYSDGSVEVDIEVTIQQVVKTLQKSHDTVYKGGKWTKKSFDAISSETNRKAIQVTGAGAARPTSDNPDPVDIPVVNPAGGSSTRTLNLPPIYSQYGPQERLKAKRVAELDAYRQLAERVYGTRISGTTSVRDFALESDQINASFQQYLKGARTTAVRYQPDGIVEVEMQMTIQQVISTVKKIHDQVYRGGKWQKHEFDEISKQTKRTVITVIGTGPIGATAGGASAGSSSSQATTQIVDEVIIIE